MTANWTQQYYDAIFTCVARYREMAEGMPDLLSFLDEFKRDVPLVKLSRWLGYVQGVLVTRGVTTVTIERDATRPLFRPLDFAEVAPEHRVLAELLGQMNEIAPLPWQADIDDPNTDHAMWTGKFYTAAEDARSTWTSYDTPDERLTPIARFVEAAVNAVPALLKARG